MRNASSLVVGFFLIIFAVNIMSMPQIYHRSSRWICDNPDFSLERLRKLHSEISPHQMADSVDVIASLVNVLEKGLDIEFQIGNLFISRLQRLH